MIKRLKEIMESVKHEAPLVHCITNPIAINDCANALLAVGAKPIMAEHPNEVEEIVRLASGLAVNLGNITDARMKSIGLASAEAKKHCIPVSLDCVGVACSSLRKKYAENYINEISPDIIKGNLSEIYALMGADVRTKGIDSCDSIDNSNLTYNINLLGEYSQKHSAVIVATGKRDLIVGNGEAYIIDNGSKRLSLVTGTGCMINALSGAFISTGDILGGAILAVSEMGIAGELCREIDGLGSFRVGLIDSLSRLDIGTLENKLRVNRII
jgi:hydroxyethylthiazole kinase